MRRLCLILSLGMTFTAEASTPVTPTTTLLKEAGNNTSSASTFTSQTNGNIGGANVSKVPIRNLLYAGAHTKMYAHWMPWFGTSSHMNVGYDSADLNQVNKQVADMMSRGFDGAIVDWYGPNNSHHNQATLYLMQSSGATNGQFSFAITEDVGALSTCANTASCDLNKQVISDLTYVYKTFEPSPAYMRIGGRPVIAFFGLEKYSLDWNAIRAGVPGNPLFIFRNAGGFTATQSDGSFAWISIDTTNANNINTAYLDYFYANALKYPLQQPFGTGYKGFNDTLASWGSKRIMNQNCGQTWLATFNEVGKYYSASGELAQLQVATWNDYEEGSEIETGIDNCVTVTGWMGDKVANWSITGQENTIDHYTVFISLDGQNLMPVSDLPSGVHSLDLSGFGFGPENYTLYVKAVGKPSLTNKMSGPITWVPANLPPVAQLSVTPTSGIVPVAVSANASGSSDPDGTVVSTLIDFGDGTVMSGATASHAYNLAGTYTVKATVTDNQGASSIATATATIVANQPPVAKLAVSPGSGVAPVTVTADASASSDVDGKIASGSIDFGDGTMVNGLKSSHSYANGGNYTITAKMTDDHGASSTASSTVSVSPHAAPSVSLSVTPISGYAPLFVLAKVTASSSSVTITSVSINWGDGTSSSGTSGSHTYTKVGSYTIVATATDSLGVRNTVSTVINVVNGRVKFTRRPTAPVRLYRFK